jgi:hypothetical protein
MLARTSLKGTVLFGFRGGARWASGGVLGGLEAQEVEGSINEYWKGSSMHVVDGDGFRAWGV